jgi:hypothetical protein
LEANGEGFALGHVMLIVVCYVLKFNFSEVLFVTISHKFSKFFPISIFRNSWFTFLTKNSGTKDTHVNFGEYLDQADLDEAHSVCSKADLCIVAGSSMSLRAITDIPFLAKKTVIVNLQETPDDERCALRLWGRCDVVFKR